MKKSIFYSCYLGKFKKDEIAGKQLLPFIEQSVVYAKEDGLDGIELLPCGDLCSDNALEYAKVLRERLDTEGVPCACYSYGISMLNNPYNALKELKKSVDIAKILGSPFLHHTFQCSFKRDALPKELTLYGNAEKIFVELGKEVAYYAGEQGLDCIYEDQGYYVNTVERLGDLIHKIGMPNTGVCLDCGNALDNDVLPEDYAGAFGPIIKHVHIKDYKVRRSSNRPSEHWSRTGCGNWTINCLPGTGAVDFHKIFSILVSAGYDGFFSLENQDAVYNLSYDYQISEIQSAFKNIQYLYDRAFMADNR